MPLSVHQLCVGHHLLLSGFEGLAPHVAKGIPKDGTRLVLDVVLGQWRVGAIKRGRTLGP